MTVALFAAAFVAMRTVRIGPQFPTSPAQIAQPRVVIHLAPPPPKLAPSPRIERPRPRRAPTSPTTAAVVEPDPARNDAVVPRLPAAPVRDSATSVAHDAPKRSITDLISTRDIPIFAPSSPRTSPAPIAPAGVTANSRSLSVAARDSIATAKMGALLALAAKDKTTEAEAKELARQREPGRSLPNNRAYNDGKHVPLMNGHVSVAYVTTVSGAGSRRVPVESAEARARRWRLQDRVLFLRDSTRADSVAKARIRP
jgi:hypothetical protein